MPRSALRRFFRHGLFPQMMVFEAVARLGSVTRAAEELHLAQPTVSTQLKKLAQTLDATLFEQQGRGLVLTRAGRELQEVCAELFGVLERAEQRLAAVRNPAPEVLRIAVVPAGRPSAARLLAGTAPRSPDRRSRFGPAGPGHRRAGRLSAPLQAGSRYPRGRCTAPSA